MQKGNELLIEYLLSVIENRYLYAENHCEKVRRFTEILLHKIQEFYPDLKINQKKCEQISFAALMHDVGKIAIPDHILHKPGKLSHDEFQIMKNHTRKGRKIFEHMQQKVDPKGEEYQLFQYCAEVCMYHHERFDGGGYPLGLAKNDIPISAQVVGLADAYDSLISERIYKSAYNKAEAFEMITEGECGIFSPRLIEIFSMVRMEIEEAQEEIERK